ncbi:hypothetical protein OO015_01020 [Thermomicrobium sp. 4228-Ro]|uniref:hypothetical protein n=1 Tax=Thermomicrobium sp. 4228-Ro TaxID=2993937 RepID=UPI002249065C|nr:hypothetical protein [Thermomicrobium sp. 4228-Ro]MCX2726085.1 hypothetical protein [Thermomicrobium sp. 4228-Ro]
MGTVSPRSVREQTPAGVIETLGTAFTILNRRPYLIVGVMALDILLWLGPRLPAGTVTRSLSDVLIRVGALPPDQQSALQSLGEQFDLLMLLVSFLPSLVSALGPDTFALPYDPIVIGLSLPTAVLGGSVLFALGIVVSMAYWTLLADVVRGERFRSRRYGRAVLRNAGAMLAYLGLLFLGAVGLSVVTSMVLLAAAMTGLEPVVTESLLFFALLGALAFYFATFFVEDAIVMSGAGPFRSALYSLGILRVTFWPAVRFIVAVSMIQLGLPLALRVFTTNALAVPFALLSYAYVATGLMLASLLFYRDRIVHVLRREGPRATRERVEERQR